MPPGGAKATGRFRAARNSRSQSRQPQGTDSQDPPMFVHLNTHSLYSPLRGVPSQPALLTAARKAHMPYLALTETNGLWGFIRFVQHARAAEVKPIAGANVLRPDGDVVLLVENQTGYENLCQILSRVHEDDTLSVPELLDGRQAGLFVLAHQADLLEPLTDLIPATHLFVELRPDMEEAEARRLARIFRLEMVVTGDVYFLRPEDQPVHRVLRAIAHNTTLRGLDPGEVKSSEHWFRTERDLCRRFPNSLDAITNSVYLAERCKTDWSFVNTLFPGLDLKATHRAGRTLRRMVYAGARKRYGRLTPEIEARIRYELNLITEKGFAPYFLIVKDIVDQTRSTIGRGSAAASIVSYCLFITQVDPIRYNLQFERFIHPERETMPDIDVDFPWDERDDILEYIFNKYGERRTAMVSNQVFLRPRSAVREVAKVYGLSNEEIKSITKRIGYRRSRQGLLEWVKTDPRFARAQLDETLEEVLAISEQVIGAFRNSSVHPGGVVIVPDDIRKTVPVLRAPKGVQIVEWEKDQVEDSGLLKIDILGNRSLAVARDTIRQINLHYGSAAARDRYLDYHRIQPVGDPRTEALLKAGKTMGVFYIESPATRQLLAKAGVVDFEHVVIYSSIIRPAANRFTNLMLERIHGKPWKLLHPDLEFLRESYGIMVYEEQVSLTARVVAGFSYAEAEALRKTLGRDSLQGLIPKWKAKYVRRARERGYSRSLIEATWEMIASFVGYSFCKPHSASYAMLSFTCAYLKAHYPAEFLAAVISNQGGFYSAYAYLSEARRFGIRLLPPDINRSFREYRGKKDRIRMGFMSIRHLREEAVETILRARKSGPFRNLTDFLMRVDLDLSDAMALTNAGCFAALEPGLTHKEISYRIAHYYLADRTRHDTPLDPLVAPPVRTPLTPAEKRRLEIESFGFPVSSHPLEPYRSFLERYTRKARDIPRFVGKTITLGGVYITRKTTATRQRDPMEFLTLEDDTDLYECVLFPESYRKYGDLLLWESLFLVRGKVEEAWGVYTITVEKLGSLPAMLRKLGWQDTPEESLDGLRQEEPLAAGTSLSRSDGFG
ncbi:MAG: DNA polymerase III subunit alpha [Candidatus Neomarinimicrobiota bacterium]|nr:MAG: DNA polymerase III subunit alpha [Candidatus Neomarinimicrobiota bacterium]